MNLNKLATSLPVDALARSVTAQAKEILPFENKTSEPVWKDSPPLMPFTPRPWWTIGDLTGKTSGRLKVIGHLGDGKWCVKCVCGNYTRRSYKSLSDNNPSNMCVECHHNENIRNSLTRRKSREELEAEVVRLTTEIKILSERLEATNCK